MSVPVAFLAVDWGTTNRRAYRIEDGTVVATDRDDRGALERLSTVLDRRGIPKLVEV